MDLVRGGGLLVLIPLVFFMLAALLGPESHGDPDRGSPWIRRTDPEEAEQLWKVLDLWYRQDVTRLLSHARHAKDAILREHCRRLAATSLGNVESELQSFVSFLRSSSKLQPELERKFVPYLQECDALRERLTRDLEWVRKQGILGVDRR
jgi:hypothetical protein